MALDRYEGYPSHYFKQNVPVQLGSEEVNAMVYIMNLKRQFGMPSPYYYQTVLEGYHDCGLDINVLDQAIRDSAQNFYKAYSRCHSNRRCSAMRNTIRKTLKIMMRKKNWRKTMCRNRTSPTLFIFLMECIGDGGEQWNEQSKGTEKEIW